MIATVRSEWIKVRTVTMNWVLGIMAFAFPLAITLLTAFFRGDDQMDSRQLLEVLTGSAFITVLLIMVIGAASITSEFGFGTIRPTFTATPHRGRVVVAKGLVLVTFAVALQAVVALVGMFGGKAIAEGRGSTIVFAEVPTAWPAVGGLVILAALAALVGLGLGLLVRSTPATVAILIIWPLMAEPLVGSLLQLAFKDSNVVAWMPFRVGFLLPTLEIFDGPSRTVAGIYFAAVALGLCALGTWAVNRKDA